MKTINICGIPHRIEELPIIDEGFNGIVQGHITYSETLIQLRASLPPELKKEVLFHEVVHGMLSTLGYDDLSNNEQFVQCFANAMYQMFEFKEGIINDVPDNVRG